MAIGKHAIPANKSHDMSTTPNSFNPSNMITHMLKYNKNESLDLIKIYYNCIMNVQQSVCYQFTTQYIITIKRAIYPCLDIY